MPTAITSPDIPAVRQLDALIAQHRQRGWTLENRPLDAVVNGLRGDDPAVFAELVAAHRRGDHAAVDVALWALFPELVRSTRRRDRSLDRGHVLDDRHTALWVTLNDLNPTDIPDRDAVLNRANRRYQRARIDARRYDRPEPPQVLELDEHVVQIPVDGSDDPTAHRVLARLDLGTVASAARAAQHAGRLKPADWQAVMNVRIHGFHPAEIDPRPPRRVLKVIVRTVGRLPQVA
jgi:hypothetical protein